ncbi:MAG: SiaC family regulatory phosphoprotein [Bacteroidia bacterium]|nr:DUF1987 domain-containing protein [Bacteroidia bacterium]MDW8158944.1 SiaC family regulatory phosphoprotein [Bacteroidia bacterium]
MENLCITATATTPEVLLSFEENKLIFRGNSYQSQIQNFYGHIIKYIKNVELSEKFTIEFYFHLINSSSLKHIISIIKLIASKVESKGGKLEIRWYYQEYDIDIYQLGQDLANTINNVIFNFISTDDDSQFLVSSSSQSKTPDE